MRLKEREITDRTAIEEIIKRAKVCRLGLCDGGKPYIIPMNFGYKYGCFFLHSAKAGRKLELLAANDRVCIEIDLDIKPLPNDKPCDWGFAYKSVVAKGRAKFLSDPNEKLSGLKVIVTQQTGKGEGWELTDDDAAQVEVFRVDVEELTGKQAEG
ncbi:MAG: pyridoxamine 5'-phosphate oxidase family protein [Deltaproteobacteria bacterium]|nr:pyridoxamine 5'-phosphate oxidase family protein [Deltaproteobacteria bacterium]